MQFQYSIIFGVLIINDNIAIKFKYFITIIIEILIFFFSSKFTNYLQHNINQIIIFILYINNRVRYNTEKYFSY